MTIRHSAFQCDSDAPDPAGNPAIVFVRRRRDVGRSPSPRGSLRTISALIVLVMFSRATTAQDLPPILQTLDSRWELTLDGPLDAASPLVAIRIPPGLYVVARDDFADVRLLSVDVEAKSAEEIPYAVWLPQDIKDVRDLDARQSPPEAVDGDTEVILNANAEAAANEIQIEINGSAGSYQRDVSVYGVRESGQPGELLTESGVLFAGERNGRATRICDVRFSGAAYPIYRVVIRNAGETPLPIKRVRVLERLESPAPRSDLPVTSPKWSRDEPRRITFVEGDLNLRNVPLRAVRVDVSSDFDFCRTAHVEVSDDPERFDAWRRVATFDLYRFQRPGGGTLEQTMAEFPEARAGFVRIAVENGADRPVTIRNVIAVSVDRWLVCESAGLADPNRAVAVYAGDTLRNSPPAPPSFGRSDFDRSLLTETVKVGPRKANPFKLRDYDPREIEREKSSSQTVWLMLALIVAAAGLGIVLVRRQLRTE